MIKNINAIVSCLKHWSHYLVASEFILHFNHEALTYIEGQQKFFHACQVGRVSPVLFFHNQA